MGKTDADDYQAKQFPQVEHATKEVNIGELVARIIKRTRAAAVYDFPETDDDPSAGFWRLNTQTLELKKPDGSVETLQPAVHTLLQTFLRNPGKRLDQQDLRMEKPNLGNAVWKLRGIIGEDKIVTIGMHLSLCPNGKGRLIVKGLIPPLGVNRSILVTAVGIVMVAITVPITYYFSKSFLDRA